MLLILVKIFVLTVMAAPEFTKKPDNASAPVGGEAKFVCRFNGEPKPEVHWFVFS